MLHHACDNNLKTMAFVLCNMNLQLVVITAIFAEPFIYATYSTTCMTGGNILPHAWQCFKKIAFFYAIWTYSQPVVIIAIFAELFIYATYSTTCMTDGNILPHAWQCFKTIVFFYVINLQLVVIIAIFATLNLSFMWHILPRAWQVAIFHHTCGIFF